MRKVEYVSASGKRFAFSGGGAGLAFDELKGFGYRFDGAAWLPEATCRATLSFKRKAEADAFLAEATQDVESGEGGTVTVDGWSRRCLLLAASVEWDATEAVCIAADLYSEKPYWRKARTFAFHAQPSQGAGQAPMVDDERSYPRNYPYSYPVFSYDASGGTKGKVTAPSASDARITFFGPVLNPKVRIGRNTYGADVNVPEGSRLVIDPEKKGRRGESVVLIDQYGTRINAFGKRLRGAKGSGSYVFEPVAKGEHEVSIQSSCATTIELVERRAWLPWSS